MDFQSIAPTLLSSKQFSPSAFLSLHHPDATFTSLQRGISNLRENVDKRGEEVRILVEREFGRFVGVKGSGDAVYKDMRTEFLAEGTDHGTREIREILKGEQTIKSPTTLFTQLTFDPHPQSHRIKPIPFTSLSYPTRSKLKS